MFLQPRHYSFCHNVLLSLFPSLETVRTEIAGCPKAEQEKEEQSKEKIFFFIFFLFIFFFTFDSKDKETRS